MSGWRSRAQPVPATSGGWRSRAVPLETPATAPTTDATPAAQEASLPEYGTLGAMIGRFLGERENGTPSRGEALARGGGQGITLGAQEETNGLIQALAERFPSIKMNPFNFAAHLAAGRPVSEFFTDIIDEQDKRNAGRGSTLGDLYRMNRDSMRQENAAVEAAHPSYYLAGDLAGGAAVPIPGGAAAKGTKLGMRLLRAAGQGAALGAGYGLGNSTADLTKGDVLGAATDTGVGALAGAGGGVLAEGLVSGAGSLLNRIRGRAAAGIKDAIEAETAKNLALHEKNQASAAGSYRSAVQSASRDLEVLQREMAALPDGHPLKQAINGFIDSPEGLAVRESVASNKLETAPERIAEMAEKRQTLADLVASKAASVEAMTNEGLRNPFQKHVAPRFAYMAKNAMPIVLGALGYHVGGVEGATVASGVGTLYSMLRGSPSRTIANMVEKPGVRKMFWEGVMKAAGGAAPEASRIIQALELAAQQGESSFATAAARIAQDSPLGARILKLVAGAPPAEPRPQQIAAAP